MVTARIPSAMRICIPLVFAALAAACAETRQVLVYEAGQTEEGRLWPARESREVPRYRYVGQLTGAANFAPAEDGGPTLRQALNWLVGLAEAGASPTVLQRPQGGAADDRGRVYVTDVSRKALFVFDETAGRLDVWDEAAPFTRFVSPVGVAIGANGHVLVSDSALARVFRLDHDGKPAGEFGAGILQRPTGIARDPVRGLVFVADTHAHDIKVFDDAGRLVETIGRRGDGTGEFNFPTYLAYARHTLYVTDTLNSRVQAIADSGAVEFKFGAPGLFVGNLVRPKGVAIDDEGNIYVVESMYDTLLVYDAAGRLLLPIGGTGKDIGKFFLPAGVWVDARNRVYVADMFNGRVVIFQFLGNL